jgi:hypothetical protein
VRIAIVIAVCIVLVLAGEWIYRGFLRPIDPLTPEVLALAEHFDRAGIKVRPHAVRHGFRHSELLAAAALKIEGFPLPIAVDLYPSETAAIERPDAAKQSPNLKHSARNGRLIMSLTMWGDDTDEMATKVAEVFASFAGSTR